MPSSTDALTEDDRRVHPRRAVCHPLTLKTPNRPPIACESVDVSVGGMRVRSSARVPLGPCEVIVSSDGDDVVAVQGVIVDEIIDAPTGTITARIVFLPSPVTALERVVALPDHGDEPSTRARRRGLLLLAAGVAAGLVVVAGTLAMSGDDDGRETLEDAAVASEAASEAAPTEPAPASTSRVEWADNTVLVELGSSAETTSVTSTMGPSSEGEVVRMQLHVTPEPNGTTLPIALTLENRGNETVRFEGGFRATVTASQDGAAAATTTLTSDAVTEVAPGEVVTIEGVLDFGATGTYDVTAAVDVS